jgi:MFS family permease
MVAIGAGMGVFTPIAWAILQETSPATMLGRSLTIYTMGAMVAAVAGMTLFGWITERFGARGGVLGTGGVLGVAAAMAGIFARQTKEVRPR